MCGVYRVIYNLTKRCEECTKDTEQRFREQTQIIRDRQIAEALQSGALVDSGAQAHVFVGDVQNAFLHTAGISAREEQKRRKRRARERWLRLLNKAAEVEYQAVVGAGYVHRLSLVKLTYFGYREPQKRGCCSRRAEIAKKLTKAQELRFLLRDVYQHFFAPVVVAAAATAAAGLYLSSGQSQNEQALPEPSPEAPAEAPRPELLN